MTSKKAPNFGLQGQVSIYSAAESLAHIQSETVSEAWAVKKSRCQQLGVRLLPIDPMFSATNFF